MNDRESVRLVVERLIGELSKVHVRSLDDFTYVQREMSRSKEFQYYEVRATTFQGSSDIPPQVYTAYVFLHLGDAWLTLAGEDESRLMFARFSTSGNRQIDVRCGESPSLLIIAGEEKPLAVSV